MEGVSLVTGEMGGFGREKTTGKNESHRVRGWTNGLEQDDGSDVR